MTSSVQQAIINMRPTIVKLGSVLGCNPEEAQIFADTYTQKVFELAPEQQLMSLGRPDNSAVMAALNATTKDLGQAIRLAQKAGLMR